MLCIIAGNYKEALLWARGQNLQDDEWFYPSDENDLVRRTNFHVVTTGSVGDNVPPAYFEKIYQLAKTQGKKK